MDVASLVLSIISLCISIATLIYTFCLEKMRLNIKLCDNKYCFNKDNDHYVLFLKGKISNKSKNPISISSVLLEFNTTTIKAFSEPVDYLGDMPKIFGKTYKYNKFSYSIPNKLDSFESTENPIIFIYYPNNSNVDKNVPFEAKLTFNTSRGQITKNVSIYFKD